MSEAISFVIDKEGLHIGIDIYIVAMASVGILIVYLYNRLGNKPKGLDLAELEVGFEGFKAKYSVNHTDLQLAYMFWVELSTRKIALPIDPEHDVLEEIYSSWYEFFKIARNHIKEIPINKYLKSELTRDLVMNMTIILNNEIRTHLTLWQAKFRTWVTINKSKPENEQLTPQQLQQLFPQYSDLLKDLLLVNAKLIVYKDALGKLIFKAIENPNIS